MGLIKEPKNVDFSTQSEPWTEQELVDFRALMQQLKANKAQAAPPTKKTVGRKAGASPPHIKERTAA